MNCSKDFGPFEGRAWLNCAHQGPLPRIAAAALETAISWKIQPSRIEDGMFLSVPLHLKRELGALVGADPDEIILGNSTSYGLHLLSNGYRFRPGDEVLLARGDFPADIFPWLRLREGVLTRFVNPRGKIITPHELRDQFTPATRLFCTSWVNSFNGHVLDVRGIAEVCKEYGVTFVLNGSQGIGAREFDVKRMGIDALVSCGYKWLCGPYGTGFCWMSVPLRNSLDYHQDYWLPHVWGKESSASLLDYTPRDDIGAAAFDLFCTANFFNFVPWSAAINYILEQGIKSIQQHNHELATHLLTTVNLDHYCLLSPSLDEECSSIVVLSHRNSKHNAIIYDHLKAAGIDIAMRENTLRFSLHLFNTIEEVDRALEILRRSR